MRIGAMRLRASSLRLLLPAAVHVLQNLRCAALSAALRLLHLQAAVVADLQAAVQLFLRHSSALALPPDPLASVVQREPGPFAHHIFQRCDCRIQLTVSPVWLPVIGRASG